MSSLQESLASIASLARAGALQQAEQFFDQIGLNKVEDNHAILALRGRLTKDRAQRSAGDHRKQLFAEASRTYAKAAASGGGSYALINAATLSFLAGMTAQARALARQVLERTDDAETFYWKDATKAEAQLLLGDVKRSAELLGRAIDRSPDAYEDHACTIRQFGLILTELKCDSDWLDRFRPPKCLHYAGPLGIRSDAHIKRCIGQFLNGERIGFGFGALAAGADIIIAEMLLEVGAELHVILPTAPSRFCEASVHPAGRAWSRRFENVVSRATSIRANGDFSETKTPTEMTIELAGQIAMGSAIMRANALSTNATQLILKSQNVCATKTAVTYRLSQTWIAGGRPQKILFGHCSAIDFTASVRKERSKNILSVVQIDFCWEPGKSKALKRLVQILRRRAPTFPPRWTGCTITAVFDSPVTACEVGYAATRLWEDCMVRASVHQAVVGKMRDPFTQVLTPAGSDIEIVEAIVRSAPAATVYATEDFVATWTVACPDPSFRAEFVGELSNQASQNPVRLYSLTRLC